MLTAEPVDKSSEMNQPYDGETHERPTRQRRAPVLFTYDTLGTPSFYHPTVPGITNHIAGVMPLSVPISPGTVVGPPNTLLNYVWPWGYPTPCGHVYPFGVYPYWVN